MKFCPLFSYEFKNRLDRSSSGAEWEQLFREVYETRSEYLDQDYLRRDGWVPTFEQHSETPAHLGIKSTRFHDLAPGLLEGVPALRWIALVRHPIAAMHSWLTSAEEFPAEADPKQEWRTGACRKTGPGEFWGFEDWKSTTRAYLQLASAQPDRVQLVSYEALVANPQGEARRLFAWADLPWSEQTSHFLEVSTQGSDQHGRSVFKSPKVAERWRSEAAPWLVEAIEQDLKGDPLEAFLRTPGEVAV